MIVLLINPGHDKSHEDIRYRAEHTSYRRVHRDPPPMSIMIYGTWLHYQLESVDIFDTHVEEDWETKLDYMVMHGDYDWVGISVIIGKHMANADEITKRIRAIKPDLPIIWGGVMCSVMPSEIKSEYGPDMLVSGGPPINSIKHVNWTMLHDKFNISQQPYYHMIVTSTGCNYNCSFCYKHSVCSSIVYRRAEDVMAEMDYINEQTGGRVFAIGDDNFLTNKDRAKRILAHCKGRGYYLEEVIGHINSLSDDVIDAMKGVVGMFIFSIETVSSRLQKVLNKPILLGSVPDKLVKLKNAGIVCNVSFMVGLPGETEADVDANWNYMVTLRAAHPNIRGNCYLWFPLPGTDLSEKAGIPNFPVREYEQANFWVKDKDDMGGARFRPHLNEKRYAELVDWGLKFNDTFMYPKGTRVSVTDDVLAGKEPDIGGAF